MNFASINVADSFAKGAPKQIFINLEHISAIEKKTYGVAGGYRIVLSTPGSATPPKADDKYPKSFFEPYSYSVTEEQGKTILAQINAIKPVLDLQVDGAGNQESSAPVAAAAPSHLGF